ncbi:lysophospholipid acyltransferase 6 isoform X2 [Nematostella vectensis]|uniref:lysophospholipid acyltransferase 6 isoform X2 n=1 Tax=Nematostella vectensis TaxID=45351 RepID=UPI00138FC247|nr:lysophospholipid acyltransferase 6 isoform X2 [Nematostella vectensis]
MLQLNVYFSKLLNVPLTQVNVFICLLLNLPMGILYRTALSPLRVSAVTRQCVGLTWGLAVTWMCIGSDLLILLGVCALCYALMWVVDSKIVHKVVFAVALGILSASQIYRMYHQYGDNPFDYTGRLMIMFQKLTYVAFSLHDGCGREDKNLTQSQKKEKITDIPSFLEYLAYMFHYNMVLVGPTCTLREYRDFITGQSLRQPITGCETAAGKRFLVAMAIVLGFIVGSPSFPVKRNVDAEFIASSSLLYRIFYAWLSCFILRLKYYFVFTIGEVGVIISGQGFNGYDVRGRPRHDAIRYVNILKVECGTSLKDATENWNITTGRWLRSVVYDRVPLHKQALTFMTSLIWHGFYPGYFAAAAFAYLYLVTGKAVRRHFGHVYEGLNVPAYVTLLALNIAVCCLMNTHYCAPFVLLRFDFCCRYYRSVLFFGEIMCLSTLLLVSITGKKTKRDEWTDGKLNHKFEKHDNNGFNNNMRLKHRASRHKENS